MATQQKNDVVVDVLEIAIGQVSVGDRLRETSEDPFVVVERIVTGQAAIGESMSETVTLYFQGGFLQAISDQVVQIERPAPKAAKATE